MSHESLTDEIKARVPATMKERIDEIALMRHLKAADIIREALRDYLAMDARSNGRAEPVAANGGEE